jgi:hypothetical protein
MFETMPRCCVECFAHEWLRDCVRENSVERGDCDYCERKDVELLNIGVLYGPFERLLGLYVQATDHIETRSSTWSRAPPSRDVVSCSVG